MPIRVEDSDIYCPYQTRCQAEALACCGDLRFYRSGSSYEAVCPNWIDGGVYTRKIVNVNKGIEVINPYTKESLGVFTKFSELYIFLGRSVYGWPKGIE